MRPFAQAAGGGAARAMAGDSEQTLQNHQQPNGGEPFLIGVSGGTASGKVRRGPGAALSSPPHLSPPRPRPGGAACGRRPRAMSVPAATAWPARLRCWPRSSAESSPRRLRAQRQGTGGRGLGPSEVPGVFRPPITGLARSPAAVIRGRGPMGEGQRKRMLIVLQVRHGGEGFKRGPLRTPGTPVFPRPGVDVLARRRNPGARGGASRVARPEGCENVRGGVPGKGSPTWAGRRGRGLQGFPGKILRA